MDSSPPHKRTKLTTTNSPPVAVLGDEYYASVEEEDVYVATFVSKSYIGKVIGLLKTLLPMPENLTHLKRVKGDEIVLAPVTAYNDCEACIEAIRAVPGLQPTVTIRRVSSKPPKTRRQFEQANALWSCNFHPSKEIESLLASTFFTPDQVTKHLEYMKLAVDVAREKLAPVGAVVVNPRNGKVVARAHDERSQNPSNHAVMMVLEGVATVQREPRILPERSERLEEEDDLPYLCTGYDLYVTREPCIMCAMAMIHCRVRRVFYGHEFESGALGSKCKVHTRAALNHHYLVFKNVLSDECRTLEKYNAID